MILHWPACFACWVRPLKEGHQGLVPGGIDPPQSTRAVKGAMPPPKPQLDGSLACEMWLYGEQLATGCHWLSTRAKEPQGQQQQL